MTIATTIAVVILTTERRVRAVTINTALTDGTTTRKQALCRELTQNRQASKTKLIRWLRAAVRRPIALHTAAHALLRATQAPHILRVRATAIVQLRQQIRRALTQAAVHQHQALQQAVSSQK